MWLRPKGVAGPVSHIMQGHCRETGWPKAGCESLMGKEKIPGVRSKSCLVQENNSMAPQVSQVWQFSALQSQAVGLEGKNLKYTNNSLSRGIGGEGRNHQRRAERAI